MECIKGGAIFRFLVTITLGLSRGAVTGHLFLSLERYATAKRFPVEPVHPILWDR